MQWHWKYLTAIPGMPAWVRCFVCQRRTLLLDAKSISIQKRKQKKKENREKRNKTNIKQEVELEVNTLWKLFQFTAKVTAIISNLHICQKPSREGRNGQLCYISYIRYVYTEACKCFRWHVHMGMYFSSDTNIWQ